MVIKDLLNKVSKPPKGSETQVRALREKLAKLQNQAKQGSGQPTTPTKRTPAKPQPKTPKPGVKPSASPAQTAEDEMSRLSKASEEEQRLYAQDQDLLLKVKEERTHKLVVKQVQELIDLAAELEKRVKVLEQEKRNAKRSVEMVEKKNDEILEKMNLIDQRLEKFMGLYEVITNQYNPFHDKSEKPVKLAKGAVSVSESLSGSESHVPVQQGRMSSENAQKIEALLAELEHDEWEKRELTGDEEEAVVVREQERVSELSHDLESMFAGFEDRLKGYLDDSLQERLHQILASLETVLNEEIQSAVQEQVEKLRRGDALVEGAIEEIESLSPVKDAPSFNSARHSVVESVRHLDDEIKAIPPSLYFRVQDGRVLKSKDDLLFALQTMPDEVFRHHVSDSHNDFADWLELGLNDALGGSLRGLSRESMISALQHGHRV